MGWIILIGIILLLFGISMLWVCITVRMDDNLTIGLRILFVTFTLFPKKNKRINEKDFTIEKFRRRRIKEAKAERRKRLKEERKKVKAEKERRKLIGQGKISEEEKPKTLRENVDFAVKLLKNVVFVIIKKFINYLRLDISEIRIRVSSDDAAKTAILYGVVSQSAVYIAKLLENIKHTRYTKNPVIEIVPDFVSGKSDINVNLRFRLRVWHFIAIGISAIKNYLFAK